MRRPADEKEEEERNRDLRVPFRLPSSPLHGSDLLGSRKQQALNVKRGGSNREMLGKLCNFQLL